MIGVQTNVEAPRSNINGPWTVERVNSLKALIAEGASASVIAEELGGGLTRNAVLGKIHRLKLSPDHGKGRSVIRIKLSPAEKWRRRRDQINARARERRARERAGRPPRSRRPSPPVIPPEVAEPTPESAVTLAAVHGPACRWIIGEPNGFDTLFCGAEPVSERSWCPFHLRKVAREGA